MNSAGRAIAPLSLLIISCSDISQETASSNAAQEANDVTQIDREELCSSIRRVSKDAINGFAVFKAGERAVPVSKLESMHRVYREYQEHETWFHLPGASDCYIWTSLDRPPDTSQWSYYQCRWPYSTLDEAMSAFRDVNRYIEICVDAEDIGATQEKDGQKISRRMFRAPNASLHLYTAYFTDAHEDMSVGTPVLDVSFQASIKR